MELSYAGACLAGMLLLVVLLALEGAVACLTLAVLLVPSYQEHGKMKLRQWYLQALIEAKTLGKDRVNLLILEGHLNQADTESLPDARTELLLIEARQTTTIKQTCRILYNPRHRFIPKANFTRSMRCRTALHAEALEIRQFL
jgi:hypothetical protein